MLIYSTFVNPRFVLPLVLTFGLPKLPETCPVVLSLGLILDRLDVIGCSTVFYDFSSIRKPWYDNETSHHEDMILPLLIL